MEFDSREAQDLNLENEKNIYFIRWFCGLALLWAFRFAYSSSFWHFFCVFYFFVWKGGTVSAVEIAMTTAIAIAISRHMKLA